MTGSDYAYSSSLPGREEKPESQLRLRVTSSVKLSKPVSRGKRSPGRRRGCRGKHENADEEGAVGVCLFQGAPIRGARNCICAALAACTRPTCKARSVQSAQRSHHTFIPASAKIPANNTAKPRTWQSCCEKTTRQSPSDSAGRPHPRRGVPVLQRD